jgi:hypothetical protein
LKRGTVAGWRLPVDNRPHNGGYSMNIVLYEVTLRHDKGSVKIQTLSDSIAHAVETVCKSEGAPERAVTGIKVRKRFDD